MNSSLSIVTQMLSSDREFLSLSERQRDYVMSRAIALSDYYSDSGSKMRRYDNLATKLGCKRSNAMRLVKIWEVSGDWRLLADRRDRNGRDDYNTGVNSPRFADWLLLLAESENRTSMQAVKKARLLIQYGGVEIPGFEGYVTRKGVFPKGFSERNLMRLLESHKKEIKRARFGLSAVREIPVMKTRVGVKPGQYLEFDDVVHDVHVIWGGESVRVRELGLLDYASGKRVHWGHMPSFTQDNGKRKGLDKKMAIMFLAYVLRYIGIHPDKCVIMMEHGTATLSEQKITLLKNCPGFNIEIRKGGVKGQALKAIGGYAARGKGNPKAKAGIESSHSPIHDATGYLPAQAGWTGRNQPDRTIALLNDALEIDSWHSILLEQGKDDLAAKLDNPAMRFADFCNTLVTIYSLINERTDHQLADWGDNTTIEYNISPGVWIDANAMNPSGEQKLIISAMIEANPKLVRERRLSPAEVWSRGEENLKKIPLSVYAMLIGDDEDFGRTITVNQGQLKVEDKMINGGDPVYYLAEAKREGETIHLVDRQQYRVVMNPYAIEELIVLDEVGRILGLAPLQVKVSPLSEDLYKTIGKAQASQSRDMAQQRSRWEATNNYVNGRRERNRSIAVEGGLVSAPRTASISAMTPAQKGTATKRRNSITSSEIDEVITVASEGHQNEEDISQITDFSDLY